MSEELIQRDAKLTVTKTVFGEETETEETIEVNPFQTTPATVSAKAGATVNLKNYESGRIDIMLSVPCYKEEVSEVFPRVKEWVDERMTKEYNELREVAKNR